MDALKKSLQDIEHVLFVVDLGCRTMALPPKWIIVS